MRSKEESLRLFARDNSVEWFQGIKLLLILHPLSRLNYPGVYTCTSDTYVTLEIISSSVIKTKIPFTCENTMSAYSLATEKRIIASLAKEKKIIIAKGKRYNAKHDVHYR